MGGCGCWCDGVSVGMHVRVCVVLCTPGDSQAGVQACVVVGVC